MAGMGIGGCDIGGRDAAGASKDGGEGRKEVGAPRGLGYVDVAEATSSLSFCVRIFASMMSRSIARRRSLLPSSWARMMLSDFSVLMSRSNS